MIPIGALLVMIHVTLVKIPLLNVPHAIEILKQKWTFIIIKKANVLRLVLLAL